MEWSGDVVLGLRRDMKGLKDERNEGKKGTDEGERNGLWCRAERKVLCGPESSGGKGGRKGDEDRGEGGREDQRLQLIPISIIVFRYGTCGNFINLALDPLTFV